MNEFIGAYAALIGMVVIQFGFATSQFIALRAGLMALSTASFACLGAYLGAGLWMHLRLAPLLCIAIASAAGAVGGAIVSIPLSRLRGIYQAIATLALVQITVNIVLYWDSMTGGARGLNGIPPVVQTWHLLVICVIVLGFTAMLCRSGIGRAFDAIRQDETVAVSLGVSVVHYHALAFMLSGAIAAMFGALMAFSTHSISPEEFGFVLLVNALAAVVLGGRISPFGPLVGAAVLTVMPEVARPLADQRILITGVILIAIIIYLPKGIVDSSRERWSLRKSDDHLQRERLAQTSRAEL